MYRKSEEITTQEHCKYGCGNIAKYKSPSGILMCCKSANGCPNNKKKNSEGLKRNYDETGRNQKEIYKSLPKETKEKMNWSKGLTKELDSRVSRPSLIGKKWGVSLNGHSQETKNKLSLHRISILENSSGIKWYQISNGLKVQGKWEVNVGEKLIEYGYNVTRNKIRFEDHHRYTPDFCIGENLYVEVKGWLSDRDKTKYRKVLNEYPDIKIFLIRNELGNNNYTKFIEGKIKLDECEDLRKVLLGS